MSLAATIWERIHLITTIIWNNNKNLLQNDVRLHRSYIAVEFSDSCGIFNESNGNSCRNAVWLVDHIRITKPENPSLSKRHRNAPEQ